MLNDAKRFFIDNKNLFGNPTEAEKFNLYNGLAALAEAIERIEYDLQQIKEKLRYMKEGG